MSRFVRVAHSLPTEKWFKDKIKRETSEENEMTMAEKKKFRKNGDFTRTINNLNKQQLFSWDIVSHFVCPLKQYTKVLADIFCFFLHQSCHCTFSSVAFFNSLHGFFRIWFVLFSDSHCFYDATTYIFQWSGTNRIASLCRT